MRTVAVILIVVVFVSMLGLAAGVIVAFALGEPPAAWARISGGTMSLAGGLLLLGAAVSKSAARGTWRGSDVKFGRLSSFAFGMGSCAMGVVALG
jgi:hypothetical protein